MKNLDSIYKVANLVLKVVFLILLALIVLGQPCTDKTITGNAYDITADCLFSNEAAINELYVGDNEERLQIYNIDISEDGKSLIIYKTDSDPIIFGGAANE